MMEVKVFGRRIVPALRRVTKQTPGEQQLADWPPGANEPVQLSEDARMFRRIGRMLDQTPKTREERVRTVREKLDGERYQVDNKHLARLILEQVEDSQGDHRAAA